MGDPTVWQYRLFTEKGSWLAYVVLRSDGFFATVSDYGNYAFRWTHPGMEFRAFVAQLEDSDDYVCSKLDRRDWFDGATTLKDIKAHICERRRAGSWTKDEAAHEWEVLTNVYGGFKDDLRTATEMDLVQYHQWYGETGVTDAHEFSHYDYRPEVRHFCKQVMPRLAALLRAELAAESAAAGQAVAHV